jgi:putative ABC transport system substrate-binding protein
VIGFLGSGSPASYAPFVEAFRQGLTEMGYVEGKNVAIEFRWARSRFERLPALAADLVERKVEVIATIGGTPSARAAKAATATIPIVFSSVADPIGVGLPN